MKPTSIIFLIVALVIVICGFALTGIAGRLAVSQNIELGTVISEDGNAYAQPEYDAENVGKITVMLDKADVNIIGGAEKSYVELINFTDGMYAASSANRVFTLSDNTQFASFSGLVSLVSNFKGLRSFVNYFEMRNAERVVNIYICDEYSVNAVDITLGEGAVNIKNNRSLTDYYVNIASGELNMDDVGTTSAVKVKLENGNVNLTDCDIEYMSVEVGRGNIDAMAQINRFTATVAAGDFNYGCYGSFDGINLKLSTNTGTINLDGQSIGGFMQSSDAATTNSVNVDVTAGNITIRTKTER